MSVSTANGPAGMPYRISSDHHGWWAGRGRTDGHAVDVTIQWDAPWVGGALPLRGSYSLVPLNRDGDWYWDHRPVITARNQEPLLATITLVSVGARDGLDGNYRIGSKSWFNVAVNPQIVVSDATAREGANANMLFQVQLLPQATETVTVSYATSDGTATAGDDYTATSGTLTFSAGESCKTISVPIINDTVDDDGETFTLTLSNPSGVVRLAESLGGFTIPNSHLPEGECQTVQGANYCNPGGITQPVFADTITATGTIRNDEPGPSPSVDDLPLVTIEAGAAHAQEGSDALFTLTRTGDVSDTLTVPVSVLESGAMLDGQSPVSATFAAGEHEPDSTVTVSLRKGSGHRLWFTETQEAKITVLDDDAEPVPDAIPPDPGVTVWTADMTVEDPGGGSLGALRPDLLANQSSSEDIEAKNLWYYTPERTLRMAFTADGAPSGRLTLHAGDVSTVVSGNDQSYSWNDVDVDWADEQTFEARLVRVISNSKMSQNLQVGIEPPR